MALPNRINPPSQISSAGGNGSPFAGQGRVAVQAPPRPRPFPWPYPESATQGAVGGAGGLGMVAVSLPPFYGPFNMYWPYQAPRLNGLPNNPLRS
jgi:hypothetical protein